VIFIFYFKRVAKYFRSSNGSFKIIHFSCETFLNKVIQKKFLLSTFIQNGLQRFLKSLPNWNQSPSRHRAIPFSSDSWEINRSFLLLLCIVFPLPWNKVHSYPSSMAATKSSQYCFFKQHEHPPWSKRVTLALCIWFPLIGDKTITCWPSVEYTLWSLILLPWSSFPSSFLSSNHKFNCPLHFS
jgi:hypothetical protein